VKISEIRVLRLQQESQIFRLCSLCASSCSKTFGLQGRDKSDGQKESAAAGLDLIADRAQPGYNSGVGGCARYWTDEEQRTLFQGYFDSASGSCPVCGQGVGFRMIHTREVVVLSMSCPACGNVALLFFRGLIGLPSEKIGHGTGC
jgi:hypothetical protein